MKRIKKVIASALTLVMSILVMCVGVYAVASAPKVGISGSISYDVGACKVRVIGNLDGAYTDANGSGTTPVAKSATDNKGQACHYYGVHDNAQSETNMLPAWNIGSVYFKETAGGAESFVITLKVENLSAYPIKATVNNTATEVLTNVNKSFVNNNAKIGVGESSEIQIKYDVTDSSKGASLTIGNELVFEKASFVPKVDTLQYSNLLTSPKTINVFNEEPIILSETETAYIYSYMAKIQNISGQADVTITLHFSDITDEQLGESQLYPLCAKQIVESGSALELIDVVDDSKIIEMEANIESRIYEFNFTFDSEQEEVCLIMQSMVQLPNDILEKLEPTISVAERQIFRFNPINNGEAYEVGLLNPWIGGNIEIPSEYNGKPVTKIEDCVFIADPSLFEQEFASTPRSLLFYGLNTKNNLTIKDMPFSEFVKEASSLGIQVDNINQTCLGGLYGAYIETLTLPSSITITDSSLRGCIINNIVSNSTNYVVENGCFIDKTTNSLLRALPSFAGIPNTVKTIEAGAFYKCNFSDVTIPSTVTAIKAYAFEIAKINNLTINANIETLVKNSLDSSNIGVLNLPSTLKKIESYAILYCKITSKVTIPASVTTLEQNCIELGDIDAGGFANNIIIENINNITTFSYSAFECINNPTERFVALTILGTTIPTDSNIITTAGQFGNIYVPAEVVETYKATEGWSEFADKISAIA